MAKRLPHPINRALIEKIAAASKTSELNSGKVVAVGPGSHDGVGKLSAVSWNEGGEKNLEVGVYAYSSAQVKKAIDIVDNLSAVFLQARFFEAAVAYKKTIGFNGTLCIEPNPQGPTKHQYDRDAATSANFLRKYGLIDEFKLSIECNNATLSSHSEKRAFVRSS